MSSIGSGVERLRSAAARGALTKLCSEHEASLLVLFGSAVDPSEAEPRDLDLAVRFDPYAAEKVLPFLDALAEVAGTSAVDLLVLNTAGPVAREQALVYGELLPRRGLTLTPTPRSLPRWSAWTPTSCAARSSRC